MGLFMKDDIKDYDLMYLSCWGNDVSERAFQFLVEWDPASLIQIDTDIGCVPLHHAAQSSIQGFQIVFGYGICYYPFKKGIRLLFQKDYDGDTPFQNACQKFGRERVTEVAEEVLARYFQDTPLNSVETLMVAAADEDVHLDCSYFLLRRKPDVLVRLLSEPHNNNNNDDSDGDDNDGNENNGDNVDADEDDDNEGGDDEGETAGNHNDEDDDDDGGDEGGIRDSTNNGAGTRKRKRKV